jgi:hypothetical protein
MTELLYLLTSLPSLPNLGERPPMSLQDYADRAWKSTGAKPIVDAVFLERDLLLRQSILVGQIESAKPLVLTENQISGKADLPRFLQPEGQTGRDDDFIWGSYYKHIYELGAQYSCEFLQVWAGFEVALRNLISQERVKKLHLAPEEYLVAESISIQGDLVEEALDRWITANDPYTAAFELDQVRWKKLLRHKAWYSFSLDEVAAYARGLLMLHRWENLKGGPTDESRGLLTCAISTSRNS